MQRNILRKTILAEFHFVVATTICSFNFPWSFTVCLCTSMTLKNNLRILKNLQLTLRRPIGRIRPEAMFFGSQGHVPEDIPKRRKNTPPKSTRRIFWKYSKRFSIWGKRWKTREKFLDTGNTLYGFHSILNLRVKFWSASPNLFSNDS